MTVSTHANGRGVEQIERDIADRRGRLAETAQALRARLGGASPEGAVRAAADEGAAAARAVSAQVRDNPLPALLIGAGVAMLLLGGRRMADRDHESAVSDPPPSAGRSVPMISEQVGAAPDDMIEDGDDGLRARLREGAAQASAAAGDVRDAAARRASDAADGLRRQAGRTAHRAADGAAAQARAARTQARAAGREAGSWIRANPMLAGALAFTAGAAVGALAPAPHGRGDA